ncbi:hypothetical protein JL475_20655 [Streptomyces sp. M2CJ-2]|uniref:hypothetical protein n=1 Tax=Streptomyces sp. M2CJ-2 TaxID=2803948 RepID=UPI0019274D43|nr:hypothetical protein [Streptomyces sp. M2CJ-2]MBL3668358.1 hypothetical protein [Streptomyces sp. M2CJ-2]
MFIKALRNRAPFAAALTRPRSSGEVEYACSGESVGWAHLMDGLAVSLRLPLAAHTGRPVAYGSPP